MHKRIKELRNTLGLTQQQFGEKLGVSRDVISNIEGNRAKIRPTFLKHLCSFYHVNEQWLIDGTGSIFYETPPVNIKLEEAIRLFEQLSPDFQEYALEQLQQLLKIQKHQ